MEIERDKDLRFLVDHPYLKVQDTRYTLVKSYSSIFRGDTSATAITDTIKELKLQGFEVVVGIQEEQDQISVQATLVRDGVDPAEFGGDIP